MEIEVFIQQMPKVELHVHIEGAVQPRTLLTLAERNQIELPVQTIEAIQGWYQFSNFPHFVSIYEKICECIQTPDDIEWVVREFLKEQARQNILYTEGTWTPLTHYLQTGIPFSDQLQAINRAVDWANETLQVDMGIVIDISRHSSTFDEGMMIAEWAVSGKASRVVAIGIGGMELGYPPKLFKEAFDYARQHGLASLPHAGETDGANSVWGAIHELNADRIYHGVRSIEDPELITYLRETQIPLDICPTSNICLGIVPTMDVHMLPALLEAGVYVTINSDDPPMFNTTLTNEYLTIARTFGLDHAMIEQLARNALEVSLCPSAQKNALRQQFDAYFQQS